MVNLDASQNNVFFRCVEDSTQAIMISDKKGHLTYVNPAWIDIYGYSSEEAMGQTPRLLRSRHQDENFYKKMWSEILDPKVGHWRGELINQAKDGREVPVELSITPIKDDNAVVGYMALALDMTEKKYMSEHIFQQDRMASVGLLASGLAHEIGTPLGVIRGRAELLKKKAGNDNYAVNGLDIIISEIDRVSKLIKNLLNLGRGHQDARGQSIVSEVVSDSVSLLEQKFRSLGVEMRVEIPEGLVVGISHNQLEQVLINLLVNGSHAIQLAAQNGKVDNHCINIKASAEPDQVTILVEDTGVGISEETKRNLFRPFYSTKPVGEGTGLGLSLSVNILNMVGGQLSLQSTELGKGSVFKVILPRLNP